MDRAKFFAAVRISLFSGKLSDPQVKGMDAILDEWVAQGLTDIRWLAYMLATAFHETGEAMQPITEYGGRKYFDKYDTGALAKALGNTPDADGDGFIFRGRGLVQITGRANYRTFGIEDNPDRALDDRVAVKIMFTGMTKGSFTGRKLSDYFTPSGSDWVNARKIINRLDRAQDIAGYAKAFNSALAGAQ
ncbi:hypothetical protein [Agrobacterium vitis]|uniref:Glycoside hydrolase family 19 catalytic domain-containing protein n=1 Tax=Agrobacterium vitis TaxID=373 RepID=A0A7K1RD78_AGRVI|nr:hypothetical protein [Agrobacterium vitis]MVA55949.1 hypothetical protein [Agrobacterium vitis]